MLIPVSALQRKGLVKLQDALQTATEKRDLYVTAIFAGADIEGDVRWVLTEAGIEVTVDTP